MNILFKKENLKRTGLTLCYLVFGVLFCVMPKRMFNFVEFVSCYLLLAAGIICVIIYTLMPSEDKEFKLLGFGVLAVAFGFCMILWHKFFGVFLSAVICYSGVCSIISALKQKRKKQSGWVTEFVIGIIVTALSVTTAILSGTNVAKSILSIFFGVILLLNFGFGVSELVILIKKSKKKVVEESIEIKLDVENVTKITEENVLGLENQEKKG